MQMRTWGRRILTGTAATAGIVVVAAAPAFAHDCYNASRSAQGDASVAAHSAAWQEVTLETVVTTFLGQTQDVANCVVMNADEYGLPQTFVFGGKQAQGQDTEIASNNPNEALFTDGKGIDHAEDVYGPTLFVAITNCGGSLSF